MQCDDCLREFSLRQRLSPHQVAHLATCASCRVAYRRITLLNRTVRTLPTPADSVPATLRSRVMDSLPADLPGGGDTKRQAAPALLSRRTALGLATAAVVAGVLIGPRVLVQNSFAAQVQAVVRGTRTWHFSGWRLREGKKVRWEVWGQRSPYFYREQIGDEVLLDDGKSCVHILPPARSRIQGMVLKTASKPLPGGQLPGLDPRAQFLSGTSGDTIGRLQETQREGDLVTLQSQSKAGRIKETATLTASRASKLPVRYTLRREIDKGSVLNQHIASAADPKGMWTQAELEAQYDVPVPDAVKEAATPAGFAMVDLTLPPADLHVPTVGSATKNGITLHAEVLERDMAGNLHLRFEGWLGNQPVRGSNLPLALTVNDVGTLRVAPLNSSGGLSPATRWKPSITDEQGNTYVHINMPPVTKYPDAPEMYLVPLEPIAAGQPLPRKLDMLIGAGASVMEWEEENRAYRSTQLVSEGLQIDLPLPTQTQVFDYDTVTSPHVHHVGPRPTLAMESAAQRGLYYQMWIDARTSTPEQKRHEIGRALFWYQEAIRECEAIPGGRRFEGAYRASIDNLQKRLNQLNDTGQ